MKDLGKLYILGDSYSTFEGFIPNGYATYYRSEPNATGLCRVEETWWKQVLSSVNAELILNDSWSGTTICNTGYGNTYCPETSFIGRLQKKLESGFFDGNTPDTVLVFGGTNDNWAGSPLGEIKYENLTDEDLKCVFPALCHLIGMLKENFPKARIIFMLNTEMKDEVYRGFYRIFEETNTEYIKFPYIDKPNESGHPGVLGMKQIADGLVEIL